MTYKLTEVSEIPYATRGKHSEGVPSVYELALQDFRESSAIHARVDFDGVDPKTIYQGMARAIGKATDVVRVMRGGCVYLTKVRR